MFQKNLPALFVKDNNFLQMPSFYQKYKNLFLGRSENPFRNQSYLQSENAKLLFSPQDKKKHRSQKYQSTPHYDMFNQHILPQITRLNQEKNEIMERKRKNKTEQVTFTVEPEKKANPERRNFSPQAEKQQPLYFTPKRQSKPFKSFDIREKKKIKIYTPKNRRKPIKVHQSPMLEQINSSTLERQPCFPTDPPSCSLVFSEYQRSQNQYELINQRWADIQHAAKFKPRGYINDYRKAVMRRVEAKHQLNERRKKLRKLFLKENSEYEGSLPLII